jgi:hypothetical protein
LAVGSRISFDWLDRLSISAARQTLVPLFDRAPWSVRLGALWVIACALAGASPAAADSRAAWNKLPEAQRASKEPFGKIPNGPLQIVISIDQQKLHLYSNGTHVAETPVATGVPQHPTPLGIFSIIQKSLYHRSNIYSGAPMPYMQRITWSGVALHEGGNLGHPASHGCIRMSHDFAVRLWAVTKLGVSVIISGPELRPEEFADSHLFVHKETPTEPVPTAAAAVPAPPAAKLFKTAETGDAGNTTDAPREEKKEVAETSSGHDAADPPAIAAAAMPQPTPPTGTDRAASSLADIPDKVPQPRPKPVEIAQASKTPIAIFISRKTAKIYVRQDFEPLFSAPVTIARPDQPLGTHVFKALNYLPDRSGFVWNVVSLPGERAKAEQRISRYALQKRRDDSMAKPLADPPPPQTPQQALARIDIPQDAIDRISQLIVPGSSLIVSDQGLGDETGEGTDFVVVTH